MPIKPMPWADWTGATVRIYRNLNNGTMSVQGQVNKTWKVVGHVTNAVVCDVAFKIQEGGRQRVIRDRRKNVHAWGQGILMGQASDDHCPIALGYDPYEDGSFLDKETGLTIEKARILVVRNNLVYVSPDAIDPAGHQNSIYKRPVADQPRVISITRLRGSGAAAWPLAA